jgi:hypothetical protein
MHDRGRSSNECESSKNWHELQNFMSVFFFIGIPFMFRLIIARLSEIVPLVKEIDKLIIYLVEYHKHNYILPFLSFILSFLTVLTFIFTTKWLFSHNCLVRCTYTIVRSLKLFINSHSFYWKSFQAPGYFQCCS